MLFIANEKTKIKKNRCSRWPKIFLIVQLPRSGNCWKSWQPLWQLQWTNVGYVSFLIGNEGGRNNHWTAHNELEFEIPVWKLSLFWSIETTLNYFMLATGVYIFLLEIETILKKKIWNVHPLKKTCFSLKIWKRK